MTAKKRKYTKTIKFGMDPDQTAHWLARQNENVFCWAAAAACYRRAGMEKDALRCEKELAKEKQQ